MDINEKLTTEGVDRKCQIIKQLVDALELARCYVENSHINIVLLERDLAVVDDALSAGRDEFRHCDTV